MHTVCSLITAVCVAVSALAPGMFLYNTQQPTPVLTPGLIKVGDSITQAHEFLYPAADPSQRNFYEYSYLIGSADFFAWHFQRDNASAVPGFTSDSVLEPYEGYPTRIEYELAAWQPSIALIMLGINDHPWAAESGHFEENMRRIIGIVRSNGTLPVLYTIPPAGHKDVAPFNAVIIKLALSNGLPLIDYHGAMMQLPNMGLSSDMVHPSIPPTGSSANFSAEFLQYGYNMRNLLTLEMLHAIGVSQQPKPTPVPQAPAVQPAPKPSSVKRGR